MRMCIVVVLAATAFTAFAQSESSTQSANSRDLPIAVDAETLQKQRDALQSMDLQVIELSPLGPIHNIDGDTGLVLSTHITGLKEGDSGAEVLHMFEDLLLANGDETLKVTRNNLVDPKTGTLRLSQSIRGIPVINGGVAVEYHADTRRVSGLTANFIPDRGLAKLPILSAEDAEKRVVEAINRSQAELNVELEVVEKTYLGYYAVPSEQSAPDLVWVVTILYKGGLDETFYVSAVSGQVLNRRPRTRSLTRVLYNANFTSPVLPGGLPSPMSDPQIAASSEATEVKNHVGNADTVLRARLTGYATNQFPSTTRQIIRYLHSTPNATWTPIGSSDYLTYSGQTSSTVSATTPRDITFHEFAHGIGWRTFGLDGDTVDNQVDALHESFGDIAAAITDVGLRGFPADATWKIVEGWFLSGATLRSMANPAGASIYSQGDWFPQRIFGPFGAHYNSTIVSYAYYLSIYGGLHVRSSSPEVPEINVPSLDLFSPALAEDKARKIFARAFNDSSMNFQPTALKLKTAAMSAALTLYGSPARTSIQKAFEAVGIGYGCSAAPATSPTVSIFDFYCAGQFESSWLAVSGANRYYAQAAPAQLGFAFATPVSDINTTQCMFQISSPSVYRVRACNNCGCGPWSSTSYLEYWSPCL